MKEQLERLTGQRVLIDSPDLPVAAEVFQDGGIGYSQLNELLLAHGLDRVSASFFQYLVDGSKSYRPHSVIDSIVGLEEGIKRFRMAAILKFGNVKYAFKFLSRLDEMDLYAELEATEPRPVSEYSDRHEPVYPIDPIGPERTFYLGYIVEAEINRKLSENSSDQEALRQQQERVKVVSQGIRNHNAYLTSDHMDVYVATSMRQPHEYLFTNEICREVFGTEDLRELRVRYFDPTQAYCRNRIDKGLSEGLMLKRAKCTLYLIQESDTFGKDSELAATLAQGKPVVAFVPKINDGDEMTFAQKLVERLKKVYPDKTREEIVLDQLRLANPSLAWENAGVRAWCESGAAGSLEEMQSLLGQQLRIAYDKRAKTLKEDHPLGLQVNLQSGVANGVIVARSERDCARLIRSILLGKLELELDEPSDGPFVGYILLRERSTRSIYRAVTPDAMLTNAFWNFYLV